MANPLRGVSPTAKGASEERIIERVERRLSLFHILTEIASVLKRFFSKKQKFFQILRKEPVLYLNFDYNFTRRSITEGGARRPSVRFFDFF
jgi:hypothetical protein